MFCLEEVLMVENNITDISWKGSNPIFIFGKLEITDTLASLYDIITILKSNNVLYENVCIDEIEKDTAKIKKIINNNKNHILDILNKYYLLLKKDNISIFYFKQNLVYGISNNSSVKKDIVSLWVSNNRVGESAVEITNRHVNWHIKISKHFQGKGYGKIFYNIMEEYCNEHGFKFIPSSVVSEIVYNIWKKRNFELVKYHFKENDDYYVRKDSLVNLIKEKFGLLSEKFLESLPDYMIKKENKWIDFVSSIDDRKSEMLLKFYINKVLGHLEDYTDFENSNIIVRDGVVHAETNVIEYLEDETFFYIV